MARIPESELERIKRETSIVTLAENHGIKLEKRGADFIGLCPFHDDHDPSFVITPETNLWHCFGCNAGGSVIDLLMKLENISFRRAVEQLSGSPTEELAADFAARATEPDRDRQKLLNRVTEFYHQTLFRDLQALEYLAKRGIQSEEAVKAFKIGYANRTLAYAVPDKLRDDLKTVGILRGTGHEHFAGSVVIPILDENGNTLEMYGRKVHQDLRKGTPAHLYLPGEHRGVWNLAAFKAEKTIILCEALLDALTFWVNGLRNVTASYGVNGFTADLLAAFDHYSIEKAYIAYDNDPAGNQAAANLSPRLAKLGIAVYRVNFPYSLDANAFALTQEDPTAALAELLETATLIAPGFQASGEVPASTGSVQPQSPANAQATVPEMAVATTAEAITVVISGRAYQIRGLFKNQPETLKVNLRLSREGRFFIDTLDLYNSKQRQGFSLAAAKTVGLEAGIIHEDLTQLILKLEELKLAASKSKPEKQAYQMTDLEKREAVNYLKQPDLVERILADFAAAGTVGEETNKLVGYLAAISRKLDDPLAIVIMSRSAAGKSSLQDAVLAFVPEEDQVKYTAITGQSLFYMEENALVHKVLAIAEDEGAEKATYAIKTMQSEKNLKIASTGKDPQTGKMRTQEYQVKGPIAIMLTTTAAAIDYETASRFLILTVDEDREQTQSIHQRQRENETLAGILGKLEADAVTHRQQNIQRMLKPLLVVNPYAQDLTFLSDRLRTRRDHKKYLGLIRAIAFLRQYQKPLQTVTHQGRELNYIEADLTDIGLANRLASEILGHSLDEMAPATRRLIELIWQLVQAKMKATCQTQAETLFSRRELREYTNWGDTQLYTHLMQLVDLEYLLIRSGQNGQRHLYELIYRGEGKEGQKFLLGLQDPSQLKTKLRPELSGG
ncbi:MAG: CHC2 zinc finger domain-containing protein [Bacillota bacterium]|jgi:DNA primase catalytic core